MIDQVGQGVSADSKRCVNRINVQDSQIFIFDDEPLESILYGEARPGPTTANLFLPRIEWLKTIRRKVGRDDLAGVLSTLSNYSEERYSLAAPMSSELASVLARFIPDAPRPVLAHDLSGLQPLLEAMWRVVLIENAWPFVFRVGCVVYRWHEHYDRFEEAREVLTQLIEGARKSGDRSKEAMLVNNFAFEYLLEQRWKEARPLFLEAAAIFETLGDRTSRVNALSNAMLCRFEIDGVDAGKEVEAELQGYVQVFHDTHDWRVRKPLMLLARIEEARGNLAEAITLGEQAIDAGRSSKTRFPELDAEELKRLRATNCSHCALTKDEPAAEPL